MQINCAPHIRGHFGLSFPYNQAAAGAFRTHKITSFKNNIIPGSRTAADSLKRVIFGKQKDSAGTDGFCGGVQDLKIDFNRCRTQPCLGAGPWREYIDQGSELLFCTAEELRQHASVLT